MWVSFVETLLASLRLDECTINFHTCDVNAACQNTAGSYTCSYKAGFTGDEKTFYGKNIMKKMPVQSILALKFSKLCYDVKSLPNIYIFIIRQQLHLNGAQT